MASGAWRSRLARGTEVLLAAAGFAHVVAGGDQPTEETAFLLAWNVVAVSYLVAGGWHLRWRLYEGARGTGDGPAPSPTGVRGTRFSFLFTVAASLTGLSAALDVLDGLEGGLGPVIEGLSVVTVICAWLLLHVGYARFYLAWDEARDRAGFAFPGTADARFVDYLYFAVTVGVSFVASDVTVRRPELRWHVMVHSVVSFLYNAIVLAVGVGVLTGR